MELLPSRFFAVKSLQANAVQYFKIGQGHLLSPSFQFIVHAFLTLDAIVSRIH